MKEDIMRLFDDEIVRLRRSHKASIDGTRIKLIGNKALA